MFTCATLLINYSLLTDRNRRVFNLDKKQHLTRR